VADTLAIYRRILAAQLRSYAAYRASFAIDLATNALVPLTDVAAVVAVFHVTRTLGGFSAFEVLVMFALSSTGFALADLVVGQIERIRQYVRQGLLDAVLVRPLSVFGQLITLDFQVRRLARVVVAFGIYAFALSHVDLSWSPGRVLLVGLAPLSAAVFFAAVFTATATVAFWWVDSGEFANGFTYGGRDFTAYPVTVYTGLYRWVFAYSLGFAFVAYYPALALLGRPDPIGLPTWVAWTSPVVDVLAVLVAIVMWRLGIRQYRSTG
jgi:viologen exporter family transport system permease protein